MLARIHSVVKDNRGSIVVEAAFIFSFLSIITVASLEYGFWLAAKSQVERVNYSLASLVRERTQFYGKRESFSNNDIQQLYELAKSLTYHRYDKELCLRVEAIGFTPAVKKTISYQQKLDYGSTLCNSITTPPLKNSIEFSPFSSRQRWLPLYQVTLILPTPKGTLHRILKSVDLLPEYVSAYTILLAR
ncbi:tight adherence pilus pseudopilin TadF [Rosenbergiella epipactidis]|uniref:tight adherence pilus pseudopilin TadF n=1 Tax=Rosenbergiella epipactidis TaxID=1544694 RepID=UPI001F4EFB28|nr:tight adherence pilus pseudopilin TadF [Rosenbergiella epipactidis]